MHPSNYQFDKYKKYRNVLNRSIEGAKRNYYNKIVTEEKHSSEKLYLIINKICKLKNSKRIFPINLLNDKGNVTTKPEEIACVLNEYFASVGYKVAQDISAPSSHIKMTKPNSCNFNSIFLFPSTNGEVCSIIDRLKTKKAQRYADVETKFIRYGKLIISPITLVNTQFGASNIQTVLGYIWGADSKNDIGFFASALVFELRHTPIILTFICYTWILSNKEFV